VAARVVRAEHEDFIRFEGRDVFGSREEHNKRLETTAISVSENANVRCAVSHSRRSAEWHH
jgi:hypothetical protein